MASGYQLNIHWWLNRMRAHEPFLFGCPMNPADLPSPEIPETPHTGKPRFKWWRFVTVLLSPVLLTALSVWLFTDEGDTAPSIAMLGGGLAGIISGTTLGRHLGKTPPVRLGLSILFALILGVVCITMSCVGCLASGYQLNIH
jgi:hypothetical protein